MRVEIDKPPFGEPCNGCGYCCQMEVCAIGKVALGEAAEAPCQFLLYEDGRHWCKLILAESFLNQRGLCEPVFTNALAIGKGCDATKDGE